MKGLPLQLLTLTLLLCSSLTSSAQSYRILLSNDDGIESPLLYALYQELAALPDVEVVVSAPNENQSGSSQSSVGTPLVVDRFYKEGEFFGYSVHGKPADSVRFGIVELGKETPFDLVVSGINRGANVGDVSHSSGTVGAAMEALYQGVPAIAVSQEVNNVNTEASARFAAQIVRRYQRQGAPEGIVVSINIPGGELKGVSVKPMGDSYLQTAAYTPVESSGDRTTYERERVIVQSTNTTSDTYAYQQGYVTITPLLFDWTALDFIDDVESWNLQLAD
jgi:5'-nucleotidase